MTFDIFMNSMLSIFSWPTFGLLFIGVVIGIVVGIIPGIGGFFVLAILIPFVVGMEPLPALALLLGAHAVVDMGGAITAVLFGVPGTGQSIATVFDGFPMTQQGRGAQGVAAALVSSLLGAVLGVVLFMALIPAVRPVILALTAGDFFMLVAVGIICVGSIIGDDPFKGLIMGALGFLLAAVGQDPIEGQLRYEFGVMYLWDGIDIIPLVIGLIAVSEMIDLSMRGGRVTDVPPKAVVIGRDMIKGLFETLKHWWLMTWTGVMGFIIGFIPGLGGAAASVMCYGWAAKRSKDGSFGKGNIAGVIAPETANSSKEAGALLPTLAFGVPGSGGMAVLLGVLIMLGIIPGPGMFKQHLPMTITLGLLIAVGNIMGTVIAFVAVRPLIRVTFMKAAFLVTPVLMFSLTGSYQSHYSLGDVVLVYVFGILGFFMKKYDYPAPPLILAFVLGPLAEVNFNIALDAYGPLFMFQRPITLMLTVLVLVLGFWPLGKFVFKKKRTVNAS